MREWERGRHRTEQACVRRAIESTAQGTATLVRAGFDKVASRMYTVAAGATEGSYKGVCAHKTKAHPARQALWDSRTL